MELVIETATAAWNVVVALTNSTATGGAGNGKWKESLIGLQQQILESLLGCKKEALTIPGASASVSVLLQQLFVSIVTQLCDALEWNKASKLVLEAFVHVPPALQKPLWRLRVIVMSKQGKNVLDGIQKMIAGAGKNDLPLQARVYAVLARASASDKQQLDAYRKAVDILTEGGDLERWSLSFYYTKHLNFPQRVIFSIFLIDIFYAYSVRKGI